MTTKPVFISYAHSDGAVVNHLKQFLQTNNVALWLDNQDLTPGTLNWGLAIDAGIQKCRGLISIASPQAKNSNYVINELDLANHYQIMIYPFWSEGNNWLEAAPLGMSRIQYIDARTDYPTALQRLLKILTGQLADKPSVNIDDITKQNNPNKKVKDTWIQLIRRYCDIDNGTMFRCMIKFEIHSGGQTFTIEKGYGLILNDDNFLGVRTVTESMGWLEAIARQFFLPPSQILWISITSINLS